MSVPDKAYIKFKLNEEDEYTEIRFHSVIFEDHEVSNEITKFPVQSGFNISNHSIRHNRKVNLSAIITNTQMLLSDEFHEYSPNNNSKAITEVLTKIVREAVSCVVVTNLTTYEPVIFNNFKTKQAEGMTDAVTLLLRGEEIQIASTINKNAVDLKVFTAVPDSERAARLEELRKAGFSINPAASLSQTSVDLSTGFAVATSLPNGTNGTMTYNPIASNAATSTFTNEVSISEDGTKAGAADETVGATPDAIIALQNGANVVGGCLVESTVGLATEIADDYLTTAVGNLRRSAYGGLYEILGVNGDRSMGQRLLGIGLDCFIVGATATFKKDEDDNFLITGEDFDTDLPTVEDALKGAAAHGDTLVNGVTGIASPTTITKITGSAAGAPDFLGDLVGDLF